MSQSIIVTTTSLKSISTVRLSITFAKTVSSSISSPITAANVNQLIPISWSSTPSMTSIGLGFS